MPFKPGQSGNPSGKPKGARNKTTLAVESLIDGEAKAITRKAIELAKKGHPFAIRLCMERFSPVPKDRNVAFKFPKVAKAADTIAAGSALVDAVAAGDISPSEAAELAKILASFTSMVQV